MSGASEKHIAGPFGLQVMPFPALNPWNWGTLGPAQMLGAGLSAGRFALDAWRISADAYRAAMREQQDLMLAAFNARLTEGAEHVNASAGEPRITDIMKPLLEATRCYADVGNAIIASNQEAMANLVQLYGPQADDTAKPAATGARH